MTETVRTEDGTEVRLISEPEELEDGKQRLGLALGEAEGIPHQADSMKLMQVADRHDEGRLFGESSTYIRYDEVPELVIELIEMWTEHNDSGR